MKETSAVERFKVNEIYFPNQLMSLTKTKAVKIIGRLS